MKKTDILKILNPVLAGLMVFQLASVLFPQALPYDAHRIAGGGIFAGIGLHLYLNWGWVKTNILKR